MHYRNGREAKPGDKVVQIDGDSARIKGIGTLHAPQPGDPSGDDGALHFMPIHQRECSVSPVDCLHVDDLAELLAEKGLDKRDGK